MFVLAGMIEEGRDMLMHSTAVNPELGEGRLGKGYDLGPGAWNLSVEG